MRVTIAPGGPNAVEFVGVDGEPVRLEKRSPLDVNEEWFAWARQRYPYIIALDEETTDAPPLITFNSLSDVPDPDPHDGESSDDSADGASVDDEPSLATPPDDEEKPRKGRSRKTERN